MKWWIGNNAFRHIIYQKGDFENMKELWELFIVFAKIGGFTFGGGYAMLPILQREVVESTSS